MRMRHGVPEIEMNWDYLNFPVVNNVRDARPTRRNAALNVDLLRRWRS